MRLLTVLVLSGAALIGTTGPAHASLGDQLHKLLPSDGAEGYHFGISIAVDGTVVLVGAYADDDHGDASGSAYLFDAVTGGQIHKLLPEDGSAHDTFGCAVAISGTIAVVAAQRDGDNGDRSGSVYVFDATTGEQTFKLVPDDGETYDYFGHSVAISGTTVIVGAQGDDDNGTGSGSAYLFDAATGPSCGSCWPTTAQPTMRSDGPSESAGRPPSSGRIGRTAWRGTPARRTCSTRPRGSRSRS